MAIRSASAGKASVRIANRVAGTTTPAKPTPAVAARLATRVTNNKNAGLIPASPEDLKRYEAENEKNKADLANAPYKSEYKNQISSYAQFKATLTPEEQKKMDDSVHAAANAQVDQGYDQEEAYIRAIKGVQKEHMDVNLAQNIKNEKEGLTRNIAATDRSASTSLQNNYEALAKNDAMDTGTLRSYADRVIEARDKTVADDTAQSQNTIQDFQRGTSQATELQTLTSDNSILTKEQERAAARGARFEKLAGVKGEEYLLNQQSTLNEMKDPITPLAKIPSTHVTPRPIVDSATILKPIPSTSGYAGSAYRGRARRPITTF